MGSFVALLRAVNVGGTGKLPMSELKAMCEELRLGRREIYVHYGDGMGTSKLVIPAAKTGTARNMNTIATLAKMAAEL